MPGKLSKFLIIRFSSIGDIVLTTPVVRSIKRQFPDSEVHYLTKGAYRDLLIHNPYIDRLHLLEGKLGDLLPELKALQFDFILDLHHNLRSWHVKASLRRPSASFSKNNLQKYLLTRLRQRKIRIPHIVERYGATLKLAGGSLDDGGLDLFLPDGLADEMAVRLRDNGLDPDAPLLAVALGAKHATKRWIPSYFVDLLNRLDRPVVLIGGGDTLAEANEIKEGIRVPCFDGVGKFGLLESAALMKNCSEVLTHDSGFMHIAAAFSLQTYVLWGNTVPGLGMYPWKSPHLNLEVEGLTCRPCSKIGYNECPKGHFKCMRELSPEMVEAAIRGN
jgi:ADP-heptose:LPS heptosyltransferase